MPKNIYTILDKINTPEELRKLERADLITLCDELRQFIIDEVCTNPGHFGASLGVVELTVALHYVYNTPVDKLVWDVGHQAYAHKILTGRRSIFNTNRKLGGISGFPRMSESEYDSFGTGHASTSISAALGMAMASDLTNDKSKHFIAVIGDGSLTGGQAFEALNNAGWQKANVLVILNDNGMAIDPNPSGIGRYLTGMSTSHRYNRFRNKVWNMLARSTRWGPRIQRYIQTTVRTTKGFFFKQSNLFHSLNFRYFGPVDGHNLHYLIHILEELKDIPGPKLLHCVTTKGKGYKFAEEDQTMWHAPGKFNKVTGEIIRTKSDTPQPPRYQDVFGTTLLELARMNDKIVGITPAMPTGCSMNIMMEEMPKRVFDVGIAESHAVTFSAGLAVQGLIPFCNIYSSFLQRSYDQVIHDVVLQKLPVILCLDRAGLVGEDGPTHHGIFDIAAYRSVPGLVMSSPLNEIELRNLMFTAQKNPQPFMIRYPRGNGQTPDWQKPFEEIAIGKGEMIKNGSDLAILTYGPVGNNALEAAARLELEGVSAAVYNMRFVKPLDTALLHEISKKFTKIITIEDGVITGGFGSAILEFMFDNGYAVSVMRLGVPDQFIEHGRVDELQKICRYDIESIIEKAKELTAKEKLLVKIKEAPSAAAKAKPGKPEEPRNATLF